MHPIVRDFAGMVIAEISDVTKPNVFYEYLMRPPSPR